MYTWKRYGGYEVSNHGDKRFSVFNATMPVNQARALAEILNGTQRVL